MRLFRLSAGVFSATLFLSGELPAEESAAMPTTDAQTGGVSALALAPPPRQPLPLTPQEQEILKKFDKNGDGKLDADEVAAGHEALRRQAGGREMQARKIYEQLLARFDQGHEGRLNADEQEQALAYLAENRPMIYKMMVRRFGGGSDGKLSTGESAAVFQFLANLPPVPAPAVAGSAPSSGPKDPPGKRLYQRLLAAFDREHAGSLNPAEQSEAVAYLEDNTPFVFDRLLQKFDQNGDGKLDSTETAAMFATLAQLGSGQN